MTLIAHYRLDGDATDWIGDFDGTINGNPSWVQGKLSGAMKSDGSSTGGYIAEPAISDYLHGRKEASVAMWVKKDAIQYGFFQLSGFANTNGNLYPYQTETRVYLDTFRTNRLGPIEMHSTVLEWHHFVVTQKPGEWKLYQNGKLVHQAGANDSISTDYLQFEIARNSGSRYADGQFDDVRIYDHALSEREVRDLSLGMVANYKMSDDLVDSVGKYSANVVSNVSWEPGVFGLASSYNGTNSYARIDEPLELGSNPRTFTLWMKKTSTGSNYNCAIHRGTATSVGSSDIWIGYSGAHYLTATIGANSGAGWAAGETAITGEMNVWYFMAVAWDGSTVRVYVDGKLEKTYTLTSLTDLNTSPLRFGASSDGAHYQFGGLVDDARIYAEALTSEEILELYQQRASIDSEGNFHSISLTEYDEFDQSINANNLIENGHLQRGDNTNFGGFTYENDATLGELLSITSGSTSRWADDLIPVYGNGVDQFDRYRITHEIRGRNEASRYYFMIRCFDKYKQEIRHEMVAIYSNTHTTLAADLVSGDDYVYLTDISNWQDDGTTNYSHTKTLLLWKDGDDSIYTVHKYSRRVNSVTEVDKTNNRLKLRYTYSGETIPAGSPAANSRSGGTYSYIGASNKLTDLDNWVYDEGTSSSTANVGSMRYASHYLQVGWLMNRNATSPASLVRNIRCWNIDSDQRHHFSYHDFSMSNETSSFDYSEIGVTRGLVAYYPLTQDTKDYADTNDATNNGAVATAEGYEVSGGSYIASNNNISLLDSYKGYTVSIMMKVTNLRGDFQYAIHMNQGSTNVGASAIWGGVSNADRLNLTLSATNVSWTSGETTITPVMGQWYHLCAVWDGTVVRVYVDGQEETSYSLTTVTNQSSILRMGSHTSNYRYMDGVIRESRIHTAALTPEEVAMQAKLLLNKYNKVSLTQKCLYTSGQIKEVYT